MFHLGFAWEEENNRQNIKGERGGGGEVLFPTQKDIQSIFLDKRKEENESQIS